MPSAMLGQGAPFKTVLVDPTLSPVTSTGASPTTANIANNASLINGFPAVYREDASNVHHDKLKHGMRIPDESNVTDFLATELSLKDLEKMSRWFWFIGGVHASRPLHFQREIGRTIRISEQMGMHLLWTNTGFIFIKPLSRFLLDPAFWTQYLSCKSKCNCEMTQTQSPVQRQECSEKKLRNVALGFLYSYICLISYESDFSIAYDDTIRLLPFKTGVSKISWESWKLWAQEVLDSVELEGVHERFRRGELRLSRLNIVHQFTSCPPFEPYSRTLHRYGELFNENIAWLATAAAFIALVLTAMQVGLATDQLKSNGSFMAVSYGFTVFAILGPIGVFVLVLISALYNLIKDIPYILGLASSKARHPPGSQNPA